jgi:hypothetical protein
MASHPILAAQHARLRGDGGEPLHAFGITSSVTGGTVGFVASELAVTGSTCGAEPSGALMRTSRAAASPGLSGCDGRTQSRFKRGRPDA